MSFKIPILMVSPENESWAEAAPAVAASATNAVQPIAFAANVFMSCSPPAENRFIGAGLPVRSSVRLPRLVDNIAAGFSA